MLFDWKGFSDPDSGWVSKSKPNWKYFNLKYHNLVRLEKETAKNYFEMKANRITVLISFRSNVVDWSVCTILCKKSLYFKPYFQWCISVSLKYLLTVCILSTASVSWLLLPILNTLCSQSELSLAERKKCFKISLYLSQAPNDGNEDFFFYDKEGPEIFNFW